MKFDGLIFDVDGTLWDIGELAAESYNIVLKSEGYDRPFVTAETLKSLFGKTTTEIADLLFNEIPSQKRYLLLEKCLETQDKRLRESVRDFGYEGTKETLEHLSKEYKIFIVTNAQKGYSELCEQKLGIENLVLGRLCYGDTGTEKGLTIKRLMTDNNLSSAVYIGDALGDEKACEVAQIPFIWASYGFGKAEKPIATIDDIRRLPEILKKLNADLKI